MLSRPTHTPMPHIQAFAPPPLPEGAASLRAQLTAGVVLQGRQIPSSSTRLLMTFVVTADKAARSYRTGCQRVDDHMHGRGSSIQAYIEGLGEFETCINSVKRSLRIFELLVRNHGGLPMDRAIRATVAQHGRRITKLRDMIEHTDREMNTLQEGEAHLLALSREGSVFEIGSSTLGVEELREVVALLYEVGVSVIHALPSPSENAELNPRPQC